MKTACRPASTLLTHLRRLAEVALSLVSITLTDTPDAGRIAAAQILFSNILNQPTSIFIMGQRSGPAALLLRRKAEPEIRSVSMNRR
jgi:hypothetical protein